MRTVTGTTHSTRGLWELELGLRGHQVGQASTPPHEKATKISQGLEGGAKGTENRTLAEFLPANVP